MTTLNYIEAAALRTEVEHLKSALAVTEAERDLLEQERDMALHRVDELLEKLS